MVIARDSIAQFAKRIIAGAECFNLSKKEEATLYALNGQRGTPEKLLMSSMPDRLELITQLIQHWREHWNEHRGEPDRHYMFGTIITDEGNTLARQPCFDLEAFRRRIDKVARQAKCHAVFVIENQHVTNFPRHGLGGTHGWHGHILATTNTANQGSGPIRLLVLGSIG
ncbi:MAG: hypothetical protein ABIR77_07770 [Sphingomicrobium sp.]